MDIEQLFEKHDDEYLKFENIKKKRANRPDVCAFVILDELFSSDRDLIDASGHDEFWLDISDDEIEKISEEVLIDLIRCGVRYDADLGGLAMYL